MIIVSPLSAVQTLVDDYGVSHVVSLLGPDTPHRQFKGIGDDSHLKLTFHDIIEPMDGFSHPLPEHAEQLVSFIDSWQRKTPILIHCWAGISRSTAAAYILLCDIRGPGHEAAIARELRALAPHAQPNRLMIRHADRFLEREGRMIASVEAMGEARVVWETEVVEVPLLADEHV